MRATFIVNEIGIGLRRNLTMTEVSACAGTSR